MAAEKATTAYPTNPTDPTGPTGQLSEWVQSVKLDNVPAEIQTRAKYIMLDGLACLLVGAHLPWSQKAVRMILSFEKPGSGPCNVFGWNSKISPLEAALLNSTFIQGFELDDWHSEAPLHSNALLLPSLLAVAEEEAAVNETTISGKDFLLAAIVGYEVGPRVGLALWGGHILTAGWHSGAIFGPAAVASAVSNMLDLPGNQIEDSLGIASMLSACNTALLHEMAYSPLYLPVEATVGIKKVFEQPYGGFLTQFSAGNGKTPNNLPDEISSNLGKSWKIEGVRLKPYASMAATHPTVDCVRCLQEQYPDLVAIGNLKHVTKIVIEMGSDAFHHGGWQATRPLTPLGAQMCCMYVAATQFIDSEVLIAQFEPEMLDRDIVWDLVLKTTCEQNTNLGSTFAQRVTVEYEASSSTAPIIGEVQNARGVDPEMSNDDILEKWRRLTKGLIDEEKRKHIEDLVLRLEECKDVAGLASMMEVVNMTSLMSA